MADFCAQCSKEMGFETVDLKGLVGPESPNPHALSYHGLCEGCGDAVVDKDGVCHSSDCIKQHGNIPSIDLQFKKAGITNDNAKS